MIALWISIVFVTLLTLGLCWAAGRSDEWEELYILDARAQSRGLFADAEVSEDLEYSET